jgi:hypothetical protein
MTFSGKRAAWPWRGEHEAAVGHSTAGQHRAYSKRPFGQKVLADKPEPKDTEAAILDEIVSRRLTRK